jgi:hypothetical protein
MRDANILTPSDRASSLRRTPRPRDFDLDAPPYYAHDRYDPVPRFVWLGLALYILVALGTGLWLIRWGTSVVLAALGDQP